MSTNSTNSTKFGQDRLDKKLSRTNWAEFSRS